ncbi:hypothetical protein FRB99_005096 [Tulasnella sp. 403]|nr:hypothetical protein FRB99_005096 [Tulasnella sp. 403]
MMQYQTQRVFPLISPSPLAPTSLPAQGATSRNANISFQTTSPVDASSSGSFVGSLLTLPTLFGDWMKIALLGAVVEFARRGFATLWAALVGMFFFTARFDDDSDAYDWLMVWLSKNNAWKSARALQASTRESDCHLTSDENVIALPDGSGQVSETDKKLIFLPGFGSTHTFFYKGFPVQIHRERTTDGWGHTKESMTLSMFGRERKVLDKLLLDAQALHKSRQEKSIVIYQPDMLNMWRRRGTRARRPLSSIILDSQIKETLLEDARDFLRSASWYSERGIPFRRGYLLHGAPGSGKTSLIHAVAGELNLDVYVISLSKPGLNDTSLSALICDLPARSIALIEDIDAAFTHDINREEPRFPGLGVSTGGSPDMSGRWGAPSGGGITLSGLLNAIDGIYAQEGRILFATTNRYSALDPALVRPGRLDMHFEFHLASTWQAREIFKCFYPANCADDDECEETVDEKRVRFQSSDDLSWSSTPEKRSERAPFKLTEKQREALANKFAATIPDRFLSMATLQGYLMRYKTEPRQAAENAKAFVDGQKKKKVVERRELAAIQTGGPPVGLSALPKTPRTPTAPRAI